MFIAIVCYNSVLQMQNPRCPDRCKAQEALTDVNAQEVLTDAKAQEGLTDVKVQEVLTDAKPNMS